MTVWFTMRGAGLAALALLTTFAQLAVLVRLGSRRFADTGTRHEPGITLLTVGGAVSRPVWSRYLVLPEALSDRRRATRGPGRCMLR
ncbi:MAG: hypothetical protein ACRDWT_04840 [Jatrophihabitantaceae bacterium]